MTPSAEQARVEARQILSERRFKETKLPRPLHAPLEWLGDRLRTIGHWLDVVLPGGGNVVWLVLATLALLFALVVAWRGCEAPAWVASRAGEASRRSNRTSSSAEPTTRSGRASSSARYDSGFVRGCSALPRGVCSTILRPRPRGCSSAACARSRSPVQLFRSTRSSTVGVLPPRTTLASRAKAGR